MVIYLILSQVCIARRTMSCVKDIHPKITGKVGRRDLIKVSNFMELLIHLHSTRLTEYVDRRVSIHRPPRELPAMVQGLDTETDWHFFNHFTIHLSRVLSLFTDKNNPFKGML